MSQDNYFFELLYEMWRERFPESTKTLEDIKDVVTDGGRLVAPLAAVSVPTQEKEIEEEEQEEVSTCVKQEESDEIKDNLDDDQTAAIVDETQDKVVTAEEKATEPTVAVLTEGGGGDSLKDEVRFYMEYKCDLFNGNRKSDLVTVREISYREKGHNFSQFLKEGNKDNCIVNWVRALPKDNLTFSRAGIQSVCFV